jgi:carbamoyl-phosphate synthase large subunit
MKRGFNVLITAAGVATAGNVISALRSQKDLNFKIVAVDADPLSYGLYLADKFYIVPKVNERLYIPEIMNICKRERIDVLIPLWSNEILLYSEKREEFKKIGVRIAISEPGTVKTCIDKYEFYKFLSKNGIPTAKTYLPHEAGKINFPAFIKMRSGSASKNAKKISSCKELEIELKKNSDLLVQELLEGREYTIDFVADSGGKILSMVPRERIEVRDGKAVKGVTVKNPEIMSIVENVVKKLNLKGPGNAQGIMTKSGFRITEINPRFAAGGLPLSVKAGANLPVLMIKDLFGLKIKNKEREFKENIFMIRYLTEIFVEKKDKGYALL